METVERIEVYRLGALCGIYSEQELIKYLDKLIYDSDDISSEIIEVSMIANKNINDISEKLRELTEPINIEKDFVFKELLQIIYKRYCLNIITLEDAIYYLYTMIKEVDLSEEIISKIQYLSDGLFLAEQNIYWDVEEIRKAFEEFISMYAIIDSIDI